MYRIVKYIPGVLPASSLPTATSVAAGAELLGVAYIFTPLLPSVSMAPPPSLFDLKKGEEELHNEATCRRIVWRANVWMAALSEDGKVGCARAGSLDLATGRPRGG